MKIKINKEGFIEIERAGVFQTGFCTHKPHPCGDSCVKFWEPVIQDNEIAQDPETGRNIKLDGSVLIHLCNKDFLACKLKDFTDERVKAEVNS